MTTKQYVYKIVEVVKVTDGDTYWLRVDVGFRAHLLINVRLNGYDCPELRSGSNYEKLKAAEACDLVTEWFETNNNLWIQTYKDPDSFGRWLGDIWADQLEEEVHLGHCLWLKGLASVWPMRWRDEFETQEVSSG